MSERPLRVSQRAEALLMQGPGGIWGAWRRGPLRRTLTDAVPRCLGTLSRVCLQVQQELKSKALLRGLGGGNQGNHRYTREAVTGATTARYRGDGSQGNPILYRSRKFFWRPIILYLKCKCQDGIRYVQCRCGTVAQWLAGLPHTSGARVESLPWLRV